MLMKFASVLPALSLLCLASAHEPFVFSDSKEFWVVAAEVAKAGEVVASRGAAKEAAPVKGSGGGLRFRSRSQFGGLLDKAIQVGSGLLQCGLRTPAQTSADTDPEGWPAGMRQCHAENKGPEQRMASDDTCTSGTFKGAFTDRGLVVRRCVLRGGSHSRAIPHRSKRTLSLLLPSLSLLPH